MSRISLCVIAKNEEKMLGECLASVRGVVDEIVVADTGSVDATVDIARAAGAIIVDHPWQNDFSAARNAALAAATGDWILMLDCDERLANGAGEIIRRAIKQGGFDCGMLPLHNAASMDASHEAVLSGKARVGEPQLLPRLLRKTPTLKWNGMIHESVTEWVVSGRRVTAPVPAHIVHYGSVPSYREQLKKVERNTALLEERARQEPHNPSPRCYLAYEYLKAKDKDRAYEEINRAWALLEASRKTSGPRHSVIPIANLRAHLQIQRGQIDDALETLKQARQWNPPHPNLDLLEGVAHEQRGCNLPEGPERLADLAAAEAAYVRCVDHHGKIFSDEVNPGATSWAAVTRLGMVFYFQGRHEEAFAAFDLALEHRANHVEAVYGKGETLIALGRPDEALRLLEPLLDTAPEGMAEPVADGWTLAAAAAEASGRFESFEFLLKQAASRMQAPFLAFHRRRTLRDLTFARNVATGRPAAGSGALGHLAALIGRRWVHPPEGNAPSLNVATPEGAMASRALLRLLSGPNALAIDALFEPRARQLIPDLPAFLAQLFAKHGISCEAEDDADFILIGGAGRSGTTLFRAMIDAHPRMCCGPEAKLIPSIISAKDGWLQGLGPHLKEAGVTEDVLDGAVKAFVQKLLEGIPRGLGRDRGDVRVAEKTPHNLLHMAYLGRLFPKARFIHVIRDGRAVAASLVKQRWINPATGQPLWYCKDLPSAARYWAEIVNAVQAQIPAVRGRYLEVRYENLVTDPAAEMARVLAFLGEAWDDCVLSHHEAELALPTTESSSAAVSEALHTDAINKWRAQLSETQVSEIETVAQGPLRRLGYLEAMAEDDGGGNEHRCVTAGHKPSQQTQSRP